MAAGSENGGTTRSRYSLLLPRPASSAPSLLFGGGGLRLSSSTSPSVLGKTVALRIHSQAEKRRRERINMHLSTLRRMIPDANKMDKASLLARVVDQVKFLKRKAADVGKGFPVPSEIDEVTISECQGNEDSSSSKLIYIKTSICCDDRPDLFTDIAQALNGLRLRTIKADVTTLGGRMRNILILCYKDGDASACSSSLKESIKEALARVATLDLDSQNPLSGKRQRLMQSQYFDMSI